jgi:hypothetical protein
LSKSRPAPASIGRNLRKLESSIAGSKTWFLNPTVRS